MCFHALPPVSIVQVSHIEREECAPHSVALAQTAPCTSKPHLILHFDMNKTLIASDEAGQKTAHDVVSAEIAERVVDCWDDTVSFPMSYADYVRQRLLPNPNHDKEIKLKQKELLAQVLPTLKEKNHPSYAKMQEHYDQAMGLLESQEGQVFASFYKLIEYLKKENISYTLVIRTFGSEASEIADELNDHFGADFLTDFRCLQQGDLQGTQTSLYELVSKSDHHLVIRDDWQWWFEHGQDWQYGKPFPVDLSDSSRISLFFDDNAKSDPFAPQSNIVFPFNAENGEPISPEELILQGRVFPVEMLEALCDEDYYIRCVERALS